MKINRNKWQTDFEKELDKAERRQLSSVKSYYKNEYTKGINSFLAEGQTNFQLLFQESDLSKIYRNLYTDIGLQFAKWYAKNYDKYLQKGENPLKYTTQWENTFASFGSAVGAQRVTLVSGTAKKTLIKITQNLMRDPDFMSVGNTEKGRILKSQFNKYSTYQAERLVRTEATNAANFATMESATTIFPGAQMQKEWIASFDDRTRDTHAEVGASEPIPYNDAFMVGGNFLMYPGDPSGPSAEVINCRCSVAPFPVTGAQTVGEITDINFGLGGAQSTGFGLGDVLSTIGTTIVSGVQNASKNVAKTVSEAKKILTDLFERNNFKIDKVSMARSLSVEQYNQRLIQLEKLFNEYNFRDEMNSIRSIKLLNKSSDSSYGWIGNSSFDGALSEINLGDITDSYYSRKLSKSITEFIRRSKSVVDESNVKYATLVHEMGHVLARYQIRGQAKFFDELKLLRTQYNSEILKYSNNNNYKSFNEIFLGKYSQVNLNEFMAESFTEYKLHSNPSKYAKLVGELIDKYYKN
jgi:hypothetical protein